MGEKEIMGGLSFLSTCFLDCLNNKLSFLKEQD